MSEDRMSFSEFTDHFREGIRYWLPDNLADVDMRVAPCSTPNNSYIGLFCAMPGEAFPRVLPLNKYYKDYTDGKDMDRLLADAADALRAVVPDIRNVAEQLRNYDAVKERLFVKALPAQNVPDNFVAETIGDISFVYYISVTDPTPKGAHTAASLTKDLFDMYGITMEQLREDALVSMQRIMPSHVESMPNMLAAMGGGSVMGLADNVMFVVTNCFAQNGAGAIFHPDVLQRVQDKLGENFFILPSSIHEVFCVPESIGDYRGLEKMIQEINRTVLKGPEFLSDHAFQYDSAAKKIVTAEEFSKKLAASVSNDIKQTAPAEGKLSVLLVEPSKTPRTVEIGDELEDLQKAVGGYIEVVSPFDDSSAVIVCNEEAKINGLPMNRALYGDSGEVLDIVSGSFLVVGLSDGEFASLTGEQLAHYEQMFHQPQMFLQAGEDIIISPLITSETPEETIGKYDYIDNDEELMNISEDADELEADLSESAGSKHRDPFE